jgi:pyruvate/2-oxoacid:ferredoxin oxidoreductase alpha subunit
MFTVLKIEIDGEITFDRIRTGEYQDYAKKIGVLDAKITAVAFGMTGEQSLEKLKELRKN